MEPSGASPILPPLGQVRERFPACAVEARDPVFRRGAAQFVDLAIADPYGPAPVHDER